MKDKRKCITCKYFRNCDYKKYGNAKINTKNHVCSDWINKRGITYTGYTSTLSYKWYRFSERHYDHPIRYLISSIIIYGIFGVFLYYSVLEILKCIGT